MSIRKSEFENNRRAFSFLENKGHVTYENARIEKISVENSFFGECMRIELSNGTTMRCPFDQINEFAKIFTDTEVHVYSRKSTSYMPVANWTSDDFIGAYVRLCYTRDTVKFDFKRFKDDHPNGVGAVFDFRDFANKYWIRTEDGGMFEFSDDLKRGNLVAVKFIIDTDMNDDPLFSHQNENTWMVGEMDMTDPDDYSELNDFTKAKSKSKKARK